MQIHKQFFCGIYRRLVLITGVNVLSIQVISLGICTIMTSVNTIRIEHWNQNKHKPVKQYLSPLILQIQQLFHHPIEHISSRGFPGMHSSRDKHILLFVWVELLRPLLFLIWEKKGIESGFQTFEHAFIGGDCYYLHFEAVF